MKLFFRESGEGDPLIILHGLFGSSDNWVTQAKLLSGQFKVYTVDQRNHGQSPHTSEFDYKGMVEDLKEFIDSNAIDAPAIVGHSMGGKTAMNFALSFPDKLSRLIVVDIAPKAYNLEHYTIAEGLSAIPVETITSRNEADEILSQHVPEPEVRQFLLKNLQRTKTGGFSWKINLPVIKEKLENVGHDVQSPGKTFDKPTLFIRGKRSKYVADADLPGIKELFPRAELVSLDTGHWVQAEKPQEFAEMVAKWLSEIKAD